MFGAYNDHRLRELTLTSDGTAVVNESVLLTATEAILDVEMGRDGYLWVTTPTTIYRLEAVPTIVPYAGGLAITSLIVAVALSEILSRVRRTHSASTRSGFLGPSQKP